jgi:hypothetical protein
MSYGSMRKCVVITAAVVSCMALATKAQATLLTTSDAYYMGVVTPDGGSPTTEAGEVNFLAAMTPPSSTTSGGEAYDRSSNTLCFSSCPDATALPFVKDDTASNNTFTLNGTQTYVIAKYDNLQAGMYVWYVAGLSGTYSVPFGLGSCGQGSGCGLSHFIVYGGTGGGTGNPETGGGTGNPETGPEPASLLLFGAALGIAGLRMRRRVRVQ